MLTIDLVRARRKKGELQLLKLSSADEAQALDVAEALIAIGQQSIGLGRDEISAGWKEAARALKDRKIADGLMKLVEDRCEFSSEHADQSPLLRTEVFTQATEQRRQGALVRENVLSSVGEKHGLSREALELALYADLRGAERLRAAPTTPARSILANYGLAQQQAVLLRAVRVEASIRCQDPSLYRLVFQKLKFRRLLFEVAPIEGGYRVTIDGPYSLFESVTKYGLALALSLPVFLACDGLELCAEIRWGVTREPLKFWIRKEGAGESQEVCEPTSELDAFVDAFGRLDSGWAVERQPEVLHLRGVGVCVPDLAFKHERTGERVYFELMGYWSREAVFRRLELVERGVGVKLLFAVNQKLRVSEGVASLEEGAALYVFKRTLNPRAVLEKLAQLVSIPSK